MTAGYDGLVLPEFLCSAVIGPHWLPLVASILVLVLVFTGPWPSDQSGVTRGESYQRWCQHWLVCDNFPPKPMGHHPGRNQISQTCVSKAQIPTISNHFLIKEIKKCIQSNFQNPRKSKKYLQSWFQQFSNSLDIVLPWFPQFSDVCKDKFLKPIFQQL